MALRRKRTELLLPFLSALGIAVVFLINANARRGRQTVLDYQRGVLFVGSKFEEVLGPGCHRFHVKKERIVVVDLRNYPIIVERFCYPDIAGKNSWISISAMIRVSDAHLAVTQCNNHVNEAVAAIGNVLRGYLPTRAALELRRERKACEQKISALLTAPLEKIGVMLSSFEITEVSSPVKDVVGTLAGVH